jgi:predicted outer membrane repeat protein
MSGFFEFSRLPSKTQAHKEKNHGRKIMKFIVQKLFLPIALLLALDNAAQAATFRVGSDGACTHNTLPAALAAAAANSDPANFIVLANNLTYSNIHLSLSGSKQITLQGGVDSCSLTPSSARTVLSGAGGSGTVLAINMSAGTLVFLLNLRITDGSNDTGVLVTPSGGGLEVLSGDVELRNIEVSGNASQLGGGVYVSGGNSVLRINADSTISNNTVSAGAPTDARGAGVYCQNGASITMSNAAVLNNITPGHGGGFYLDNCNMQFTGVLAASSAPPLIANNRASSGGGIYARNRSKITSLISGAGFTATPVWFNSNQATGAGGALYLEGDTSAAPAQRLSVTLKNGVFTNNIAQGPGGAIYLLNRADFQLDGGAPWVRCDGIVGGGICTRMTGNRADIGGAIAGVSSTNTAENQPQVLLYRIYAANNSTQGNVGSFISLNGALSMANSIVTQHAENSTFLLGSHAPVGADQHNLWFNTISGNTSQTIFRSQTAQQVSLYGSIVHNTVPVRNVNEGAITFTAPATCLPLFNENVSTSGFGALGNPGLDANFTPGASAFAVDVCPSDTNWSPDIYDRLRPIDLPVTDINGQQDLGAVERQVDAIFASGFE